MLSQRPEDCQRAAGMATGKRTSCPSIKSISSRRILSILRWMRVAGGSRE